MYDYNCPDCNEAKLQSDKNARKINEVIDQVNALIQVNNETVDFIEEKANEVVEETAKIKVNEVLGDLNKEIDNINSSLDNIMNEFNEHITNHPSGGIDDVINSLEPSINDIPKVYFTGDISSMSKDVEKILAFSYKSNTKKINGFVKMKLQGTSSLRYPKKNFTIKMFKDEGCLTKDKHSFKEWNYETNKYVLKANYIDHSHARNIVSARLWNDIVKARTDYNSLPTEYQNMPNGGAIDGFPIKLYMNGVYQGLYTWNIGKDSWTYGMKSEKDTYAVLCGENYVSGCFRANAMIDETDWSLEYPDTLQNSIKTSWNNAINFVMNNSGNTFKNGLSTYFDVNSLIDYYIFAYFSCGLDSMGKNQIYTTYNGTKWYAHMYDMDSTWGLYWDGRSFVSSSYRCQEDYESGKNNNGNLLYIKLVENFRQEIYERYSELRKTVLSIDNVIDRFERFTDVISNDLYKEDISVYNGIPSSNTNNIQQIRNYIVERANYVDGKIAELSTEPVPITGLTLNKSTTSVNVGSTDILTVGYLPSNTTQKGIIWSSSDTSKATVTDGVILGISNGDCIITATSTHNSSVKANCNVNIQIVDYEELKPVYEIPNETIFTSTNDDYIDTEIQLFDTDKSFTIFIDFTSNMDNDGDASAGKPVLHCMYEQSPWNGLVLDGNEGSNIRIASQSNSTKLLDANGNPIKYYTHVNQKYILVKESESDTLKIYNYNYRQIQTLKSNGLTQAITNNLVVGCVNNNGIPERHWNGTVHKLKVWFRALETNEINNEFGENIF